MVHTNIEIVNCSVWSAILGRFIVEFPRAQPQYRNEWNLSLKFPGVNMLPLQISLWHLRFICGQ